MRLTYVGVGAIALCLAGAACKKKPQPATGHDDGTPMALQEGERPWPEGTASQLRWQPRGTTQALRLYTVRTANNTGVLRAQQGDRYVDLERFTFLPAERVRVKLLERAEDRVLVEYGPAQPEGGDPSSHVALLLGWDAASDQPQVLKRWSGAPGDRRPSWTGSGQVQLAGVALQDCRTVVQKVSACASDPGFRRALTGGLPDDERLRIEQALDRDGRGWGQGEQASAQCRSWANGAHSSALSDPDRLSQLARESKLSCAMFGHELEDEGGLPLTDRRQARRARTIR